MRTLSISEYEFETETYEEQRAAGRYHPASVIVWRGYRHTIGAGTSDDVNLFEEGGRLYVTATNKGLGYIGLEIFEDGEPAGDTFTQDYDDPGAYILGLSPIYAAKRLAEYCYC